MVSKRERTRFIRMLISEAKSNGVSPPFTITVASPTGTVHTIKVAQNGAATHTVEHRKPEQVDVDLLEGMMIIEPDKASH